MLFKEYSWMMRSQVNDDRVTMKATNSNFACDDITQEMKRKQ